jgi:hypothetical protein
MRPDPEAQAPPTPGKHKNAVYIDSLRDCTTNHCKATRRNKMLQCSIVLREMSRVAELESTCGLSSGYTGRSSISG